MKVDPIKTRLFQPDENLVDFIIEHIPTLQENTVLAITSKIVALAEGRYVDAGTEAEKEALIRKESQYALKTKYCWLTLKDNTIMATAGIDESNAEGKWVLLPKDSYTSAEAIRKQLQSHYGVKNLGVIITDSRTVALRKGVTGVSLGYAGFEGLKDYVGKKDLYDRPFKMSRQNIVESLAVATVFVMGEGAESQPIALVQDAPIDFVNKPIDPKALWIDLDDDMYAPMFHGLKINKPL
jgi:F420-0:gamma-glutamyl ligase